MIKIYKFIMMLCLCVAVSIEANAYAYDFIVDGIYYKCNNGDEVFVTCPKTYAYEDYAREGYYSGEIVIPASVEYMGKVFRVTGIGDEAFLNTRNMTKITLPNTITRIGASAFDCSGLMEIDIPNSVTSIGDRAFNYCYNLKSVKLPNSVTDIKANAFESCVNMIEPVYNDKLFVYMPYDYRGESRTYKIPDGIETILAESLKNENSSIDYVTIPKSVTKIGPWALDTHYIFDVEEGNPIYDSREDCNCIVETATNTILFGNAKAKFPASVTAVGDNAFYDVVWYDSISIPNTIISIGNDAFSGSTIKGDIPEYLEHIGTQAFAFCRGLENLTIPKTLDCIADSAFRRCNDLQSLTISDGVKTIGNGAFISCNNLTSLNLGNTVTTIGENAFHLESHSLQSVVIPNSVTTIGASAFQGNYAVETITIGSSVREIGKNAFYNCAALKSVINLAKTPQEIPVYNYSDKVFGYYDWWYYDVSQVTLHVCKGCKELYEVAEQWKEFGTIVEDAESLSSVSGDANGDGVVDVADITAIAAHILGNTPEAFDLVAADANIDGTIDVADITAVAGCILGLKSNVKCQMSLEP